jgi:serine/threonine-protein kinase Chk1
LGATPWNTPIKGDPLFDQFVRSGGTPSYAPWNRLPPGVYNLLQGMLEIDPAKRFTLADVQKHPWTSQAVIELDSVELANRLMSKMHIDLQIPVKQEDLSQSSANMADITPSQAHPRSQVVFEEDPSLSQFTGAAVLETLTQKARRFADVTGSERLTRFYSTWPVEDMFDLLLQALREMQLNVQAGDFTVAVHALDQRNDQLIGFVSCYPVQTGQGEMTLVDFAKRKGDPQEWRRLFKLVARLCRDAVFVG